MNVFSAIGLPEWLWLAWVIYWVLAARTGAPIRVWDSLVFLIASQGLLVLGVVLLFTSARPLGVLDGHFVPLLGGIRVVGDALTAAGLGLAIWARVHLGRYWSGQVTLKLEHQLIRTGPYAFVRHPIYSGILLGLIGTMLWVGEYRALLSLPLFLAGLWWKARREEALLATEFGDEYALYRQQTGMLVPRLGDS
jgi:protein-S-isoprenylcysteine O-methyltransferase Ste14